MTESVELSAREQLVHVTAGSVTIEGNLNLPKGARAIILFAHGSGSSRHSSRNRYVARMLNKARLATLLIDLLTADEEEIDEHTAHLRFDIRLLAEWLVGATGSFRIPIRCNSLSATSARAPVLPPLW